MAKQSKKIENNAPSDELATGESNDLNSEEIQIIDSKKQKKPKKEKKSGGGKGFPVVLLVVFLLIAAIVAGLAFNLFGLRTKYLDDFLRKVPIVGRLIPEPEPTVVDEYAAYTKEEMGLQIDTLKAEVQAKEEQIAALEEKNNDNVKKLAGYSDMEQQQLKFKEEKAQFDSMIALNDPKAYQTFYELIRPENAERLYREVVTANQVTKELKKYVSTVTSMDADAAAKMLESMMKTDMNLVVLILKNIDAETSGAILGAMKADNAASILKQMAPK